MEILQLQTGCGVWAPSRCSGMQGDGALVCFGPKNQMVELPGLGPPRFLVLGATMGPAPGGGGMWFPCVSSLPLALGEREGAFQEEKDKEEEEKKEKEEEEDKEEEEKEEEAACPLQAPSSAVSQECL